MVTKFEMVIKDAHGYVILTVESKTLHEVCYLLPCYQKVTVTVTYEFEGRKKVILIELNIRLGAFHVYKSKTLDCEEGDPKHIFHLE